MELTSIRWDIILGGFGLFLIGINFMGDGLKAVAGDKLRDYIDKYTTNPFSAFLIGIAITIVMQSSSASTAITIGLVRAGLMNLEQAAGIVMGANIGTTVTSLLISLDINKFVLYFVFVGAMIICFGKKQKIKSTGYIILGFGLIFFGLNSMGDELAAIKDVPAFMSFAEAMSTNPFLSLLAGTIMTGAVQASAATIGVVQKMYEAGALTFSAVLPFVFGANIGTTVTGVLASIGGSTAAKRTAGIHILFNIIGTTIGMIFLTPYANFVQWICAMLNISGMMQIAVAHIMFNTVATIVFFPLLRQFCSLIRLIVRGEEPKKIEINIDELDAHLASTELPAVAISAARDAIFKLADVVSEDVSDSRTFLNKPGTDEDFENLKQSESMINSLDRKITEFLVQVSANSNLTAIDQADIRRDLEIIKNLERLGDLSMNLSEFYKMVQEDRSGLTSFAMNDINGMYDKFKEMYAKAIAVYRTKDKIIYEELMALEEEMDKAEYVARQAHFTRMSKNQCESSVAASIYCDILGTLERMGDHCCNIAKSALLDYVDASFNPTLTDATTK